MNRTITLGGESYDLPRFSLRYNRLIFPLCRKLSNGGLVERIVAAGGAPEMTEEDLDDLIDVCFHAARSAQPGLTREAFEELPISPGELFGAFVVIRLQTGVWRAFEPGTTEGAGEGEGEPKPPTSTSAASLRASSGTSAKRRTTG